MTTTALIVHLWVTGGVLLGLLFRRDMDAGWPTTFAVMLTWPASLPAAILVEAYARARKK